ncbi:MAG: DUF134 domain-containing protein [Lachnospirales bacterium]
MARPIRCRRICLEPEYDGFKPEGLSKYDEIILSVDEYEVIRLIDYERKTHLQCAEQMGISRTTVTEIYEKARVKIADCIVNGKALKICGGNYKLCDGSAWKYCGKKCDRANFNILKRKDNNFMKIAVTYENGNVFQHFGHTENFKIYNIEDNKVLSSEIVSTNGTGHGALAGFLTEMGVDTLICGGIGAGAQNALADVGIKLYGGVKGNTDEAVESLLKGSLNFNPDVKCNHHGHDHHHHGHSCGNGHSCH